MRKIGAVIMATFGFFMAAGAGGGIECDTMGWEEGLTIMAVGLVIMWGAALWGRSAR